MIEDKSRKAIKKEGIAFADETIIQPIEKHSSNATGESNNEAVGRLALSPIKYDLVGKEAAKTLRQADNSISSQRSRILHYLKNIGPMTTLGARHELDIMHPAMRVRELRKAGYSITTIWTFDSTPEGRVHRVGRYILMPRAQVTISDFLQSVFNKNRKKNGRPHDDCKQIP